MTDRWQQTPSSDVVDTARPSPVGPKLVMPETPLFLRINPDRRLTGRQSALLEMYTWEDGLSVLRTTHRPTQCTCGVWSHPVLGINANMLEVSGLKMTRSSMRLDGRSQGKSMSACFQTNLGLSCSQATCRKHHHPTRGLHCKVGGQSLLVHLI